ncbi:MAG: type I 3-dehydroquinate dehydratase, partial [Candidatus Binatia bacterium]
QTLADVATHLATRPLISTFRPREQGGHRELTIEQRLAFWKNAGESRLIDIEEDIAAETSYLSSTRICSYHDFAGVPDDIDSIFDRLADTGAEILKIAVGVEDAAAAIPVWKLLLRAKNKGKHVIPVAMGEAGKWTRILGLAHGSLLTYASLETGSETAPGQISAKDMREVYRVNQLAHDTKVFGIVGDPVSQSLSPYMHNPAFVSRGINAVFVPFLVKDLGTFLTRMVRPERSEAGLDFGGLSVTMPHKQTILKYIDNIDETALAIGAVNTVKVDEGRLTGYNTDAHGFITPLKKAFGDLRRARVAVFGAGGAARACVFALKREGSDVTVFVRNLQKAERFAKEFDVPIDLIENARPGDFAIVVDATPFGMKGDLENKTLFTADELAGVRFVYDLVTKPTDTPIIREAKDAGIPC